MLMTIWELVFVLFCLVVIGGITFIYGFYSGIEYMNLDADEVEEMHYQKENNKKVKLAKVGSWILNNTDMRN